MGSQTLHVLKDTSCGLHESGAIISGVNAVSSPCKQGIADMVLKRLNMPDNRHLPHTKFQRGLSDAPLLKSRDCISQVPGFYRHYWKLAGSGPRNTALHDDNKLTQRRL
ncbi:hypothetical protein ATCC53582_02713 [Novacetimonas hansenii]|nr:hypothetical protein ATCC53582_02713 [Novacetimonas hansenii]